MTFSAEETRRSNLPGCLPLKLSALESDKNKAFCFDLFVRKEEITKGSITPEFPPFPIKHWRRSEGKSLPVINERQAALEQKIK